jgi:hypothetical protein
MYIYIAPWSIYIVQWTAPELAWSIFFVRERPNIESYLVTDAYPIIAQ